MIETPHAQWKGVPLYSLYSETRKPTPAMLADVDALVVDLQDIGTRIYTYIYTMSYVMEAAAEAGQDGDRARPPQPHRRRCRSRARPSTPRTARSSASIPCPPGTASPSRRPRAG